VAVGVPLLVGCAVTAWWGDPWSLPSWVRWVGGALVVAFGLWNGWSLISIFRHRTGLLPGQPTTTLITTGPYALSRNPLYVGLVTCHLAVALLVPSLWALLLTPVAVIGLDWGAIRPEESYLRERFGANYEAYARRVRRWL
jgi:protein-S-isoprenylcysteine O-methyltransferase Ste14